jgi:hypothetical protein
MRQFIKNVAGLWMQHNRPDSSTLFKLNYLNIAKLKIIN